MRRHLPPFPGKPFLLGAAALLLAPPQTRAQEADFLFKRPLLSVGVHVGYSMPRAGSDLFDFTREQLTLDRRDFYSVAWRGDLALRIAERVDVGVNLGYAGSSTRSEFRDWVDQDDQAIEQTTRLRRIPLTANVRVYLRDRGRSIGQFAWVPAKWSPYVGAGAGWVWYLFEQQGDFVDFETFDIFSDTFMADGATGTVHVAAGIERSLGPRFLLRAEGRYSWADGDPGFDFVDFDDIDLAGFQLTVGLAVQGS
jgi:hypothetical protein